MMKSRYNLEFLGIAQAVKERDLETQLVDNLQRFLLELEGKLPTAEQLATVVRQTLPPPE
jgi:hypothetical protein